jgi:hypothetical protein
MTFNNLDWTILWKFYHFRFFWTYLGLGIGIKGLFAWRFEIGSPAKMSAFAILASLTSSALNTWFPVVPLAGALILECVAGDATARPIFTSVPVVALAMSVEGTFLDWVLVRVFIRSFPKRRLAWVFVLSLLNSSLSILLVLVWVAHHPFNMIAAVHFLARRIDPLT